MSNFKLLKIGNDLSVFPTLNHRMIAELNEILSSYLPRLHGAHTKYMHKASIGAAASAENPFTIDSEWIIDQKSMKRYKNDFLSKVESEEDSIPGWQLRNTLMKTGVPETQLKHIWELSDKDKDGSLNLEEYCIAMFLIDAVMADPTKQLPNMLPPFQT